MCIYIYMYTYVYIRVFALCVSTIGTRLGLLIVVLRSSFCGRGWGLRVRA